jgi:lipoate-protein ligase A
MVRSISRLTSPSPSFSARSRSLIGRCFSSSPRLRVLDLTAYPQLTLFSQLALEESLYRTDASQSNWLLMNRFSSPHRCIVMGASGRPELWLNLANCHQDNIPIIKRFSGGGTVFTDHNTLFLSFIFSSHSFPGLQLFPKPTLQLIAQFYSSVFNTSSHAHPTLPQSSQPFLFLGNDFCFGNYKFAGNAQSIGKSRFLTHSSILWDYDIAAIERYLKIPIRDRQPEYRKNRGHGGFLTKLKDHWNPSLRLPGSSAAADSSSILGPETVLMNRFVEVLQREHGFDIEYATLEQAEELIAQGRKTSEAGNWQSSLSWIELNEEIIQKEQENIIAQSNQVKS